jgi:hypothetical protein
MTIPIIKGRDLCTLPFTAVRDFPPIIRTALSRAAGSDAHGLSELSTQERSLLCRIIRNVNATEPSASIRIANETLAIAMKVSDRTIRRIKVQLEAKGWFSRSQIQSRRYGMQISDVWLSSQALNALGLTNTPAQAREDFHATEHSTAKPQPSELLANGSKQVPATTCFTDELPADLIELRDVAGLTVGGIRLLMGLASRSGTKLGLIFTATRDLVLASREPFAYLKKLIQSGRDWSQVVVQAQAAQVVVEQEIKTSSDRSELVEAFTGRMFSHAKQLYVWSEFGGVIHQARVKLTNENGLESWQPLLDTTPLVDAWKSGKLFEINHQKLSEWKGQTSATESCSSNRCAIPAQVKTSSAEPCHSQSDNSLAYVSHAKEDTQNKLKLAKTRLSCFTSTSAIDPKPKQLHKASKGSMRLRRTLLSDALLLIPQSLKRQLTGSLNKNPSEATPASRMRRVIKVEKTKVSLGMAARKQVAPSKLHMQSTTKQISTYARPPLYQRTYKSKTTTTSKPPYSNESDSFDTS